MASVTGVVSFEAAGARHDLRYGINALCRIEDRLGVTVFDLGQKMQAGLDVRTLRTVFACGLADDVTDDAAGDLMDELGVQRAGELVGEAFQAAFPQEKGGKTSPRKAAAATGSTG